MKRYIFYIPFVGALFSGCAFTSSQVAQEYNQQQRVLYSQYANAKAVSVQAVMEALQKIDRGGMKIELDESGRVKAIKYTERLDPLILKQALAMPAPKQYVPKSGIAELGDFFLKFGSFATPITAMWMNYKSHKVDAEANVAITQANAKRDADMYNAFTSNYRNNVTTTTTTSTVNNNKEVQSVTNNTIEKTSSDIVKESVTNNNNNGGNQNVGQTNRIIPFGIDDIENGNTGGSSSEGTGGSIGGAEEGESGSLPPECLPGTLCENGQ